MAINPEELLSIPETHKKKPVGGWRKYAIATGATLTSLAAALGPVAGMAYAETPGNNANTTEAINLPSLDTQQLLDNLGISPLDQKVNYQALIMTKLGQPLPQFIDRISSFTKKGPADGGEMSYLFQTQDPQKYVEVRTVQTPNGEVVVYRSFPLDVVPGIQLPVVSSFGTPIAEVPIAEGETFYNFGSSLKVWGSGPDSDPNTDQVVKIEESLSQ